VVAVDTNLLVYAHRSALAEHQKAKRAIERAASGDGWGIPFSCVAEFWAVVTHPASAGRPSEPREARDFLAALKDAGAQVLYPAEGFMERVARVACEMKISGPGVFDLQIALTAQEAGARTIWTHDRNFVSVRGLSTFDPIA
jgi:toxin-antitoxin system PIN domain toxin